ncbi:MAG: DUF167 family protein [Rhodospirillales bacterium]|nr:DUF167 family protein [Rhodospirillales bacterium]
MGSPFVPVAEGVRVLVRASPKSAKARVLGLAERPDGRADLRLALKSAPEGGRANAELIAFLAEAWGVPKRSLALLAGAAGRRKTVLVAGDPRSLEARLKDWLARSLEESLR